MKILLNLAVSALTGLAAMWACYEVLELNQMATTFLAVLSTSVAYGSMDRVTARKSWNR